MRMVFLLLSLAPTLLPTPSFAALAPDKQMALTEDKVLRGTFIEQHVLDKDKSPVQMAGHFTVAPAYGLIWAVENPLPTSTIVTPDGAVQEIAGMAVKLPAKNLHSLYAMVKAALAGQWDFLEKDFTINRRETSTGWTMALYPKTPNSGLKGYKSILVQGETFVNSIVLTKPDGTYDALAFSNGAISALPLTGTEQTSFQKAQKMYIKTP